MIVGHLDSNGNKWFFRVDAPRNSVAVVARKLFRAANRVKDAKRNGGADELSRALLAEAVALSDLQAYNSATEEEFLNAPPEEQFLI